MNFVLIAVGSRGDAEPFCSLAEQLIAAKQSVDLFLQENHEAPSSSPQLQIHRLPFTTNDFYRFTTPKIQHDNPRVVFVSIVAEVIGELVLPCFGQIQTVVKDDTIVIASSLARQAALALKASKTYLVQLQPLQPTTQFPHSSHVEECVAAILNQSSPSDPQHCLETYLEPERYQHKFLMERLVKLYNEYGLGPVPDFALMLNILKGNDPNIRIVNAFSSFLVPTDNEWQVGPLADNYHTSYTPDNDLLQFLKDHPRPICVGFGSMPFNQVQDIVEALGEVDRAAILVGSCFDVVDSGASKLFVVKSVPYPWLFPQCSMVLHHGGAGVVHAALRAGVPHVASPSMGDQFFWGKLLQERKLGVRTQNVLHSVTKDDLVNGITRADMFQANSKNLGEAIRQQEQTGPEVFVDKILLEISK